jgi:predicted DCC family thiol-disulfide oxidoreductase YuxK
MSQPAPLLVVYDAESNHWRRRVDWIQKHDSQGLIVSFPFQNPELLRIAPELAGRPLHLEIHGMDTRTRQIWVGEKLLPQILARLPRWRWMALLSMIPGATRLLWRP